MTTPDPAAQAAREALADAADYLLPGDRVGSEFLIYLAVTKYGRGEFDPATLESLIERRELPHVPTENSGECATCGESWPCPSVRKKLYKSKTT